MKIIKKLSQNLIAKIAAGEVVERPSSAIKELVENAIDAKATQIKITLENNGLDKIKVSDNGHGMSKENLEQCFKRHTTSKIRALKDLEKIMSLGFRGEALYSIAAVSELSIKSKVAAAIGGWIVQIKDGKIIKSKPVGMPEGTTITVENLFYNTPVRKKFLSKGRDEFKKVLQIVMQYGLAHPNINFTLTHNKKIVLNLPSTEKIEQRLEKVLGNDLTENLLGVDFTKEHLDVKGFVTKPQAAHRRKQNQYIYINDRSIKNTMISDTIKKTFGTLLEPKAHPSFVLHINIPHEMVDVNIHPRKEAVEFTSNELLIEFLQDAVKKTLEENNLTYQDFAKNLSVDELDIVEFDEFVKADYTTDMLGNKLNASGKKGNAYMIQMLKDSAQIWNIKTDAPEKRFEEIIQIKNLYLITETKDGVIFIDQHAAHERILYEEFLEQLMSEKNTDLVEVDFMFDLPLNQAEALKDNVKTFSKIGITVEHFGGNSFKIVSIPKILEKSDFTALINDALADLAHDKDLKTHVDDKSLKTISYLACRSAIKGGDYLTQIERKNLLKKLDATKTNYTCPHGRPVKFEIDFRKLEKMFKRS